MLSLTELKAVRASLIRLAGEDTAAIADHLKALDWAIQAEADLAEMKAAGAFKCPEAHRRIRAKHRR